MSIPTSRDAQETLVYTVLLASFYPLCLQYINCLSFFNGDNRFLPLAGLYRSGGSPSSTNPLRLAGHPHHIHLDNVHIEEAFNRATYINFVGIQRHFEGILVALLQLDRFFSHDTLAQYFSEFHVFPPGLCFVLRIYRFELFFRIFLSNLWTCCFRFYRHCGFSFSNLWACLFRSYQRCWFFLSNPS